MLPPCRVAKLGTEPFSFAEAALRARRLAVQLAAVPAVTFDKRVHLGSRISGQRACPFPPAASRLVSAWTGVPVPGTVSVPGISRTACRGGSSTVGSPLPLLLCCRAVLVRHAVAPPSAPVSPVDGRAAGFQAVAKAVL